jgi:murein L,D-transpeptidase YcbB/YkuD
VKPLLGRALGAALLASLIPATASAQSFAERYPAIATGLGMAASPSLPATGISGRYVLVDAASARLFMIEDGRIADSMKVVVGKPSAQTPEMNSALMAATLNPYWNVPTDLTKTLIAPKVLKEGLSYLDKHGYEVVTAFEGAVERIPADSVDWQAVAEGTKWVYVRQKPGPGNSMGQVKFTIRNGNGIFLHDTPKKELFSQSGRELSNGCVRLEDAPRLARWLFGRDPRAASAAPEQQVRLVEPVPIVITRLEKGASFELAALR